MRSMSNIKTKAVNVVQTWGIFVLFLLVLCNFTFLATQSNYNYSHEQVEDFSTLIEQEKLGQPYNKVSGVDSIKNIVTNPIQTSADSINEVTSASSSNSFISTWNTTLGNSTSSSQISLPLIASGSYNFLVDWGDGLNNTITSYNQTEVTHIYAVPGVYTINITGLLIGWSFNNQGDKLKIVKISHWGNMGFGNSTGQFYGSKNLHLTAKDAPDLSGVTSLSWAFAECTNLGNMGDMNNWDVSHVTNMSNMFYEASTFNQPMEFWDVSHVTDMSSMFFYALSFDQPIGIWNVSSVTDMSSMFCGAKEFSQQLGMWDVSHVTNMGLMFEFALSFNQPISTWDVSHVTSMVEMFDNALSFNQPIGTWNVSSVTDMSYMFAFTSSFNKPIGSWNVSNVKNMMHMFSGVTLSIIYYDQILLSWASLPLQSGVPFDAGDSLYSKIAKDAREFIIATFGWKINDGGFITVPDAPSCLYAQFSINRTYLHWCSSADGNSPIISYNIYRSIDNGTNYMFLSSVPANTTQYIDSPITLGQAFYYTVKAENNFGESNASKPVYVKAEPIIPYAPRSLTGTAKMDYIALTWSAPIYDGGSPLTGYYIYRSTSDYYSGSLTAPVLLTTVSNTNLNYDDYSVVSNKVYYYIVTAVNKVGESKGSDIFVIQFFSETASPASSPGFEMVLFLIIMIPLALLRRKIIS